MYQNHIFICDRLSINRPLGAIFENDFFIPLKSLLLADRDSVRGFVLGLTIAKLRYREHTRIDATEIEKNAIYVTPYIMSVYGLL